MKRGDPDVEDLVAWLEGLPPPARQKLCARLGVAPEGTSRALAPRIRSALATSGAFGRLVAGLSEAEVELLGCWGLRAATGESPLLTAGPTAVPDPLSGAERQAAAEALARAGLALSDGYVIEVLPAARALLVQHGATALALSIREDRATCAPAAFGLALAVGLVDVERPLLRADGRLHAASLKRVAKRVPGGTLAGAALPAALAALQRLGAATAVEHAATRALRVDRGGVERLFRLTPRELAHAVLWDPEQASPLLWTYARLRAAARRVAPAGSPRGATLSDLIATELRGPNPRGGWSYDPPPDGWDTLQSLKVLAFFGLVESVPEAAPPRLRTAEPAPHGTAAWVVQPTFDVLVPWDAPPGRVALLGLCADLEQVDRVCRFRLTPTSIGRGLEHFGGSEEILALLEAGAAAPLAQNVRATIVGWGGRQRPLRSVRGEILLVEDAAQASAVRALAPDARQVAQGVLLLPPGTLEQVLARARASGMAVAATQGAAPRAKGAPRHESLQTCEALVRGYLERADAEAPLDPAKSRRGGDAQAQALLDLLMEEGRLRTGALRRLLNGEVPDDEQPEDAQARREVGRPRPAAPSAPQRPTPWPGSPSHTPSPGHVPSAAPTPTWAPMLPGPMRERLQAALTDQRTVRLLYRNSVGRTVDRTVTPLRLVRTAQGECLEARDEERHAQCTLVLQRITALAAEPGA